MKARADSEKATTVHVPPGSPFLAGDQLLVTRLRCWPFQALARLVGLVSRRLAVRIRRRVIGAACVTSVTRPSGALTVVWQEPDNLSRKE